MPGAKSPKARCPPVQPVVCSSVIVRFLPSALCRSVLRTDTQGCCDGRLGQHRSQIAVAVAGVLRAVGGVDGRANVLPSRGEGDLQLTAAGPDRAERMFRSVPIPDAVTAAVRADVQRAVDDDGPDRYVPAQGTVNTAGADLDLLGGAEPVENICRP